MSIIEQNILGITRAPEETNEVKASEDSDYDRRMLLVCLESISRVRAERFVWNHYRVKAPETFALQMILCYFVLHGVSQRSIGDIINFTGCRRRWKNNLRKSIEKLIVRGFVLRLPGQRRGFTLRISDAGYTILREYARYQRKVEKDLMRQYRATQRRKQRLIPTAI